MNKAFNLEEALAGKPVVTRDGRKVTQIEVFEGLKIYPVVAHIADKTTIDTFQKNGEWDTTYASDNDLRMLVETVKKTYYLNIYKDDIGTHKAAPVILKNSEYVGRVLHSSLEVAQRQVTHRTLLTTVKVEWEEAI